jgi:2-isopropylmalate synthase
MTRRLGLKRSSEDHQLKELLSVETPVVTIVGKSWDLQVIEALRGDPQEYLEVVFETVRFLNQEGREVIFDAEHFFDGYKHNPEYALKILSSAVEGGAQWLVLCDTNGGTLPWEVFEIVKKVRSQLSAPLGIHTHNDIETGVANALSAVRAGATQVQGTIGGIGERCGNANLISIIANLSLKMGYTTLPSESLSQLTSLTYLVWEILNEPVPSRLPYVGSGAFAHKGGMHISGVKRNPATYEHISPESVGNRRHFLLSDLSGRSALEEKLREFGMNLPASDPRIEELLQLLKRRENEGYVYEGAEASFELLVKRELSAFTPHFRLRFYRCINDHLEDGAIHSEATICIEVNGEVEHTAGLGNGPVSALDRALRKALIRFYPSLSHVVLTDYKVRVLSGDKGTDARVRVLITSTDGEESWGTVGVSTNILDASFDALVDALEYKLLLDAKKKEENSPKTATVYSPSLPRSRSSL